MICIIYFFMFLVISIFLFFYSMDFMISSESIIFEIEMFSMNSTSIVMSLLFDWMSLMFASFVLFISSMVIYYSKEYMEGDLEINRFILLVVMFVLSMLLLIFSPNLISILLGWDGLGLVSYCLVIYYQNWKSYNAGMLTALTNRLGDVAFLISISWMMSFGSWNYIYFLDCMKDSLEMNIISFLMLFAAMTKSAQIPFSSWLPAAMAAPTPVSALVHSSTLVTAGVYLLIRFNLSLSLYNMYLLMFVSGLTMFMAGLGASYEFDLKKIIALSTLSQLGLMMSILSMGGCVLAFYHLLTHALFKALLFMCAGVMIHYLGNNQDIRSMGGLINQLPLTCTFFIICNLSLCGLPFLSGFYSKDLILDIVSMNDLGFYVYLIYYFSTGLTVAYTIRLIYYVVVGNFNFQSFHMIKDSGIYMLMGMAGLIMNVVFMGSLLSWIIFPYPYIICMPLFMKMMVIVVMLLGLWGGYEVSKMPMSGYLFSSNYPNMSFYFGSMWYMPYLSTFGMNYLPLMSGNLNYEVVDRGWSEYLGSQNLFNYISLSSRIFQLIYKNHLKIFLLMMVLWILVLLMF
uniref:NADH-ubiquinone oxidoreductase chain 5 n=1 Tax=Cyclommatus strigiceps vitalisi TaxID=618761 RepID=A0A5H2EJT3_9SCAR|nr:NADH dehydrogenase subunit 5 [Cyclommatus strigiceps vitalisi]ASF90507.1 NADH dehydrogenase subunit 5 [Cyclommatus strigiceps vitalisi]